MKHDHYNAGDSGRYKTRNTACDTWTCDCMKYTPSQDIHCPRCKHACDLVIDERYCVHCETTADEARTKRELKQNKELYA